MSLRLMASDIVVTLVANPEIKLEQSFVDHIFLKTKAISSTWLDEGLAVDLIYTGRTVDEVRRLLNASLLDMPCDVFVQPISCRRKKLLIADMESTIIEQEMLDELAGAIGVGDKVSDITRRAMNGELDFKSALCERVELLKGQSEPLLRQVSKIITFMPGAKFLIATMKAHGAHCWLVSGGFTYFTDFVATELFFDRVYANQLILEDGIVTGRVADPILDKNAKKTFLEAACKEYGISMRDTVSVGDGANDVPMLEASNAGQGLGIAYHAKPSVRAVIPHQVNQGDLTALLYAQGYQKSQFAI